MRQNYKPQAGAAEARSATVIRPYHWFAGDTLRTSCWSRRSIKAARRRLVVSRPTLSRSSPRAARASRRWSTNGSSDCRPTIIAAPRQCSAGLSTAKAQRSAPRLDEFLNWRWTNSASNLRPRAPLQRRGDRRGDHATPRAAGARRRRAVAAWLDTQLCHLKDQGVRALLRALRQRRRAGARVNCAYQPACSQGYLPLSGRHRSFRLIERLSDEAAQRCCAQRAWGTDKELKAATHDFAPSAVALLARDLPLETQAGSTPPHHIRAYFADPEIHAIPRQARNI